MNQFSITKREGWKMNRMGVGTWGFGGQYGLISEQEVQNIVSAALEAGVNFFDTADAYGTPPGLSEERLSKALGTNIKDVFIATKVGNFGRRFGAPLSYHSPYHIELCCDASLHRLKRDYIDVYLCHIPKPESPEMWVEAFSRLKERGKIRAWGISCDHLNELEAFDQNHGCSFAELDYSILNTSAEKDLFPYCRTHQISTIIRGPLHQGLLSGKIKGSTVFQDSVREKWNESGKQRSEFLTKTKVVECLRPLSADPGNLLPLAMGYVLRNPDVTVVIPGVKNNTQLHANLDAEPISDELHSKVRRILENG